MVVETNQSLRTDVESGTQVVSVNPIDASTPSPKGNSHEKKTVSELTSGIAYCVCSFSMILTNKLLASSFEFNAPNALLLCQFMMTVLLIDIAGQLNIVQREALDWRVIKIWWPVNCLFVAMIGTGFYALKTLQVPMVTLLKNLTNLLTILGDMYFFNKHYTLGVWMSLVLMALSAVVGSMTDLSFHPVGYTWQLLNCAVTAAYALYLKNVLNRVDDVTSKKGMSDITKVYYNHLLGLPWLLMLIVTVGESQIIWSQPAIHNPWFLAALFMSGFVGFAVSYSSIRFMGATTSTTFVMTGSLNKIPTAILGWVVFRVKTTVVNVLSVLVGLCAGVVFVRAKAMEKK